MKTMRSVFKQSFCNWVKSVQPWKTNISKYVIFMSTDSQISRDLHSVYLGTKALLSHVCISTGANLILWLLGSPYNADLDMSKIQWNHPTVKRVENCRWSVWGCGLPICFVYNICQSQHLMVNVIHFSSRNECVLRSRERAAQINASSGPPKQHQRLGFAFVK